MIYLNLQNPILCLTLISLHFVCVDSFEYGMIAYFEEKCPDGWEEFTKSAGSVIIGVGTTFDLREEQRQFTSGEIGGSFSHAMNISELATHSHTTGVEALYNKYGGGKYIGKRTFFFNKGFDQYYDSNTSTVGEGKPFNIIQPYIALVNCRYIKQKDEQYLKQQQEIQKIIEQQSIDKQEFLEYQQKNQKEIQQILGQQLNNQQENISEQKQIQTDVLDLKQKYQQSNQIDQQKNFNEIPQDQEQRIKDLNLSKNWMIGIMAFSILCMIILLFLSSRYLYKKIKYLEDQLTEKQYSAQYYIQNKA